MKHISLVCILLAGISLLAGVIFKLGWLPASFLGTVPSTWVQLAQLFLVAAIALRCCCHHHCKCKDKDGEKKDGQPCCK
jgi:hypothetical protein